MYLGRVIGTVVASVKYEGLDGAKLMIVAPVNHRMEPVGEPHVAVDTVRAGSGDLVYLVGSREAALALDPWFVPVDAAIVGIVDQVDADGTTRPPPPEFHKGRAMKICRVKGTVVGTAHHPAYDGKKLLIVQPLDERGEEKGDSYLAVDVVQAGRGDVVLVATEGNGARQILKMGSIVPIRSLVVGIVDAVEVAE